MKYLKPKSVTWLAGLGLILTGLAEIVTTKNVSLEAITKIGEGLGLIGIRGAIG